ncbi:MAG: DUF2227 family putative metal-binding protein [Simkania sp.]|uniref:Metal-binding protein n=1 Tax=Simkania negevensis (strain ATCC VR-1471 / DSM 27360 / Z) TaxID=331113 RepID=F8L835_SIMNZ|nr:DUF2227 family putative metal-binding protein [Simkania negevensis]MCB1066580.1 DUF2227 family putative metal-binding protein [Simkania sp.]MCP5490477.1 DUF2227 family putative metal-binding protein [Chlamydiales bacterium]MCB1074618.1 DUF2227 family putative metal-binding protein [Simkania sp.]MCB1084266.1 DUF2227 family putative metal-binding protein [Simkania sp.]CCB88940.1 hypothetical protein SNE_A10630 [Simkania negevensis Z]
MSQYKEHSKFNIFVALPVLLAVAFYFLHPHYYLLLTFAGTFTYSTLFMSPDMDLAYQIRLFSLRGLFSLPFRSYAQFFSHRGLSHHVIFGSATRILWLAAWGCLLFLVIYKTLPTQSSLLKFYKQYELYILYGLAGICLADWCHLLLDRKELKKKKGRR